MVCTVELLRTPKQGNSGILRYQELNLIDVYSFQMHFGNIFLKSRINLMKDFQKVTFDKYEGNQQAGYLLILVTPGRGTGAIV
jgi:hypothetical protein